MKKWILWLLSIVVLLMFVLWLFYTHADNLKKEKLWYISELHYDFSAQVDSMIKPGRGLIHVVRGEFDPNREWQLKDDLKYHGILHLFVARNEQYDVRLPSQTAKNDSLYINSNKNRLSLYRKGELIITCHLSESLRQQPFRYGDFFDLAARR